MDLSKMTIKVNADVSKLNVAIEKVNQLKSLLQEVKELAASLDISISFGCEET